MKKYLFIFLLFSFTSCSLFNGNVSQKRYILHTLGVEEDTPKERIGESIIFCKTTDTLLVGCTDVLRVIKEIRNNPKYKNIDYKKFISNLLLYKNEIECNDPILTMCFPLNDTITQFYNKELFKTFLSIYTDGNFFNGAEYRIIKNLGMTENSFYTILYYLYNNGYYSYFSELLGYWFCRNIDDFHLQLLDVNVFD